jgi:hypothetical protein
MKALKAAAARRSRVGTAAAFDGLASCPTGPTRRSAFEFLEAMVLKYLMTYEIVAARIHVLFDRHHHLTFQHDEVI